MARATNMPTTSKQKLPIWIASPITFVDASTTTRPQRDVKSCSASDWRRSASSKKSRERPHPHPPLQNRAIAKRMPAERATKNQNNKKSWHAQEAGFRNELQQYRWRPVMSPTAENAVA